ncbi:hypothetical protein [Nocardioides pacificus]
MATEVRGLGPGSRPALLVSEMQRGIVDPTMTTLPGLADHVVSRDVVGRIAALAALCRRGTCPLCGARSSCDPTGWGRPPPGG